MSFRRSVWRLPDWPEPKGKSEAMQAESKGLVSFCVTCLVYWLERARPKARSATTVWVTYDFGEDTILNLKTFPLIPLYSDILLILMLFLYLRDDILDANEQ